MGLDYIALPKSGKAHAKPAAAACAPAAAATAAPAEGSAATCLEDLPVDALECILVHLSLRDRLRASAVSKAWSELIRDSPACWRALECPDLADASSIGSLASIAGHRLRRLALRCIDPVLGLDAGAPVEAVRSAVRASPNLTALIAPTPDTTAVIVPGSTGAALRVGPESLWSPSDVFEVLERCPNLEAIEVGLVGAVNDALADTLADPRVRAVALDLQRSLVGPQAAAVLASMLAGPAGASLRSLCLDFNSLQDLGCGALASALPSLPSLTAIAVGFNDIGDAGARALALAIPQSRVARLDLRHNHIGPDGARHLAAAAAPAASPLRSISFQHNRLGSAGVSAVARALASPGCPLLHLELGNNEMLPSGAKALVAALRSNATLEHLGVSFNSFGVEEAKDLARTLHRGGAPRLRSLDVSRNALGCEGVRELCGALKEHRCIQELRMQVVAAGPEGARRLGGLLRASPTLRLLDAAGNNVGDRGAREMAAGAVENAAGALTALHLEMNAIADDGAHALAQVVRRHRSLRVLGLAGNGIGCDGAGGLAAALRAGTTLRRLDLSRNWLVASDRGSQSLRAAAAQGVPSVHAGSAGGGGAASCSGEGCSSHGSHRPLHAIELVGVPS